MRLNLQTDYALRMLMSLATQEGRSSAEYLADLHGISRNHLVKVAAKLAELGFVTTQRGRSGGISLAKPPQEINVGTVVRAMESLGGFVECFDPITNTCRLAGQCGLQGALNLALGDFLKRLDQYSLADFSRAPGFQV